MCTPCTAECTLQHASNFLIAPHTAWWLRSALFLQIPYNLSGAPLGVWEDAAGMMEAYHVAAINFQLAQVLLNLSASGLPAASPGWRMLCPTIAFWQYSICMP